MFGRDGPVIDLDDDADAPDDIEQYVARRLRAGGRGDLVEQVAPVLAGRATEFGGFLYGEVLTSLILRRVIDVSAEGLVVAGRDDGRRGVGSRPLAPGAEAVDTFRVLTETDPTAGLPHLVTSLDNLADHFAGLDRISDGVDVYSTCVDAFAESPEVRDTLIIERTGFHVRYGDPPTGFRELATLLGPDETETNTPDAVVLAARNALRGHRNRHALDIDHAWWTVNRTGSPDRLSLPPEQISVALGWITAPTWRQSKSYLAAHEEELLADSTFVALEELLLLVAPRAERHLELLDEILAAGIDAAYRPLLLEDLVTDWISVANWQESRSFAEEHATELITREAEIALLRLGHAQTTVVHLAVLGLAQQDGLEAAYGCVTDRRLAADRMAARSARRSRTPSSSWPCSKGGCSASRSPPRHISPSPVH